MTEYEWLTTGDTNAMLSFVMEKTSIGSCCPEAMRKRQLLSKAIAAAHWGQSAAIIREIVGNPFWPIVTERQWFQSAIHHACVVDVAHHAGGGSDATYRQTIEALVIRQRCLTPTVLDLARGIEADGDFDRLPVLADALEDAGCHAEPLLMHLRGRFLCPGCSCGETTTWYGGGGGWCAYCDRSGPQLNWIEPRDVAPAAKYHHAPHCAGCWALDLVLERE